MSKESKLKCSHREKLNSHGRVQLRRVRGHFQLLFAGHSVRAPVAMDILGPADSAVHQGPSGPRQEEAIRCQQDAREYPVVFQQVGPIWQEQDK
jgi:hypothetical protein